MVLSFPRYSPTAGRAAAETYGHKNTEGHTQYKALTPMLGACCHSSPCDTTALGSSRSTASPAEEQQHRAHCSLLHFMQRGPWGTQKKRFTKLHPPQDGFKPSLHIHKANSTAAFKLSMFSMLFKV